MPFVSDTVGVADAWKPTATPPLPAEVMPASVAEMTWVPSTSTRMLVPVMSSARRYVVPLVIV